MRDLDGNSVAHGSTLGADVCVIGGGAAGIAIAREFSDTEHRVLVLESGGHSFRADTQSLNDFVNIGHPLRAQQGYISRNRYLGGSTNTWHGQCAPLDAIDLEERAWVPYSGWPVGAATLSSYYAKACEVLKLPALGAINVSSWRGLIHGSESGFLNDPVVNLETFLFADEPVKMREQYVPSLQRSSNIQILLNSNVTEIESDESESTVKRVQVATLSGGRFNVVARRYVLACGGWENARLLLASRKINDRGLGNSRDVVGRFYMEHPKLIRGKVVPATDVLRSPVMLWRRKYGGSGAIRLGFKLSAEAQKQGMLLNHGIQLVYPHSWLQSVAASEAVLRKLGLSHAAIHALVKKAPRVFSLLEKLELARINLPLQCEYVSVFNHMEQIPNPESRLTLDDEKDALGVPRLRVKLAFSADEKRSLLKFHAHFHEYLRRHKLGGLSSELPGPDEEWSDVSDSSHHMGTTRMSDDPRVGVVDADCRIHGMDNLYVAGSSVFPTGGHVNPTMTIIALSLRLADTLKADLSC